jgi:hypothetical protein
MNLSTYCRRCADLFLFAAAVAGFLLSPVPVGAQTSHFRSGGGTVLAKTADHLPRGSIDEGLVRSNLPLGRLILLLQPSSEQEAALHGLLDEQQDRNSPHYHQWLTPQQFGQRYGLGEVEIQEVRNWLEESGFSVSLVSKGGRWIEFSGTAYQVNSVFHAKIHRIDFDGRSHILNTQNLTVPDALALMVAGVVSLNDFFKHPEIATVGTAKRSGGGVWALLQPTTVNTQGQEFLSPADFAAIYNLNALYQDHVDGSGQQVSVPPAGLNTITATYLGSPEFNAVTSTPAVLQVGSPGFELSGLPTALSIVSGQSGSIALTLTPQNGFTGTASLSCSGGVPAGASCTFAPSSVSLNAANAAATLTLDTQAPSAQSSARLSREWLIPTGASFALFLIILPAPRPGRRQVMSMLCLMCVGVLLQSCGGGSSGTSNSSTSSQIASTSTVLTSSSIKAATGSNLTLTAKVASTGTPTGTVTFYDGSTSLGQGDLGAGGMATLAIDKLAVGTHELSAQYAGDKNNEGSKSGTLDEAITGTVQLAITATSGSLQESITIPVDVQ